MAYSGVLRCSRHPTSTVLKVILLGDPGKPTGELPDAVL